MPAAEYYRSERFIWDHIRGLAASGVPTLYATWKKAGKVEPFVLSWPAETILSDEGVPTEGTCLLSLPEDVKLWSSTIRAFAAKTKAYALLLTEQLQDEVRVTLESHHGTRSWSLPIRRSGDIRTLGPVQVKDDTHKIGLLWGDQGKN